jgi:hypothetical protein
VYNQDRKGIDNLTKLNPALLLLSPSISGIDLSMLEVKGASLAMLDAEIQASPCALYNGMKRTEVLTALRPGLAARVDTFPIAYAYDTHGDKHFPGGPAGTKFTAGQGQVNPTLEAKITPLLGRIRRHANGAVQTYYLTDWPTLHTGGQDLCIQIDYVPDRPETITYHGYPRGTIPVKCLSTKLGGPAIP